MHLAQYKLECVKPTAIPCTTIVVLMIVLLICNGGDVQEKSTDCGHAAVTQVVPCS